jgi:hypothetical protein
MAAGDGLAPSSSPSKGDVLRLDDPAKSWWPARVTLPLPRIKSPLYHFNACEPGRSPRLRFIHNTSWRIPPSHLTRHVATGSDCEGSLTPRSDCEQFLDDWLESLHNRAITKKATSYWRIAPGSAEHSLERTTCPNARSQHLRNFGSGFVQVALIALAGLILHSVRTCADVVYVWSNDGTLQEFSVAGVASPVTTNLSGWNGPVGLVCDNVGNVYAGDPGRSTIWRFSPNGNTSDIGIGDSESGLAFDSTGHLYATSPNWNTLEVFDYSLGHYHPTPYLQRNGGSYPLTLTFDSANNIYVASNTNAALFFPPPPFFPVSPNPYDNTIQKFASDLTHLGSFASGLNWPWGMAFDNDGNLYVANSGTNGPLSNTILKFTTNGAPSTFATASNGLSGPKGLAFDSAGNLYVANSLNGTTEQFTPDGTGTVFASGLNSPCSIAIYPGLKVWSATPIELSNPTISPTGALQFSFIENPGLPFTVLATTNASSSLTNWTVVGNATEPTTGHYQFTDPQATNYTQRFYRLRSP